MHTSLWMDNKGRLEQMVQLRVKANAHNSVKTFVRECVSKVVIGALAAALKT